MSKTVEFLFDVGSPYTYLAYHQLPKIAEAQGARIVWTPVLLGWIFQATGNKSPTEVPAKGHHLNVDLQRWAKAYGITVTPCGGGDLRPLRQHHQPLRHPHGHRRDLPRGRGIARAARQLGRRSRILGTVKFSVIHPLSTNTISPVM